MFIVPKTPYQPNNPLSPQTIQTTSKPHQQRPNLPFHSPNHQPPHQSITILNHHTANIYVYHAYAGTHSGGVRFWVKNVCVGMLKIAGRRWGSPGPGQPRSLQLVTPQHVTTPLDEPYVWAAQHPTHHNESTEHRCYTPFGVSSRSENEPVTAVQRPQNSTVTSRDLAFVPALGLRLPAPSLLAIAPRSTPYTWQETPGELSAAPKHTVFPLLPFSPPRPEVASNWPITRRSPQNHSPAIDGMHTCVYTVSVGTLPKHSGNRRKTECHAGKCNA